jgi:hydroxymethylpyrimidine pyrophosphatase-like HAD family hydrolase
VGWQAESEQRPHKLSYYVGVKGDEAKGVISRLQDALSQAGVRAKLIYSGGVDLDILPEGASKGKGLEFLLRQVPPAHPLHSQDIICLHHHMP